jgi:hypothetical protein
MREHTLRSVLMVAAIEDVDRAGTILPPGDRARATQEAMRAHGISSQTESSAVSDAAVSRVLGARAERLIMPVLDRHPIVAEVLGRTRTPLWILAVLLVLAFASGVGLSALDGSRRINILAFPFLGLLAWNLAVYVLLLVGWVRRIRGTSRSQPASRLWAAAAFERRIGPLVRHTASVDALLGKAVAQYAARWAEAGRPYIAQHLQRWLHLAAAAVALGLIAGLYVRGTVLRYEVGWESTFLGAAQVKTILGILYGPVARWSGVALPATVEAVESLRWTSAAGGGDAAPWIHLIALTLACFVVVPRVLLAGLATLSLGWLGRSRVLPEALRPYAGEVLRGGGLVRPGGVASVTPYSYEPSDAALAGLERWLESVTGSGVRMIRRSSLRYGEAEMARTAFGSGPHREADLHVVLMSLAATPEAENHGEVIAAARDAARRARPPAAVRVVVDESPYAERFAGDASLAPRLEERRRLWREFVAGYGLDADLAALEK